MSILDKAKCSGKGTQWALERMAQNYKLKCQSCYIYQGMGSVEHIWAHLGFTDRVLHYWLAWEGCVVRSARVSHVVA